MSHADARPRVVLTTYRGHPHSGGQGVYVRHVSRELARLGIDVEVLSGPPYPEIDDGVRLTRVPSLDLYRQPDPFRCPRPGEFRSPIDVLEYLLMCTAGFPEPLTFSLRVARLLARRRLRGRALPDLVHDNQGLGYGLLALQRLGLPVVATVHHPITVDRALELAAAPTVRRRATLRRWYGFVRMQRRVVRRLDRVLSVSSVSARGVEAAFGLRHGGVHAVPIGVDQTVFSPRARIARRPGRLMTIASADVPLKGLLPLLEALAKVRVERRADLVVVGRPGSAAEGAVARLGLSGAVRYESAVSTDRLVTLFAEAEVAVVPSLYEGFSLPAVEAMACGVPLVATTGGALPEVVGPDGSAGFLVPPGDAEALASRIGRLLDDRDLREGMGRAGRERVARHFTWHRAAERLADHYRDVLDQRSPPC